MGAFFVLEIVGDIPRAYFIAIILFGCAVGFLLGLVPVLHYARSGYRERREEIIHYFNSEAIAHYFDRFRRAKEITDPKQEFALYYDQRFGLVSYRYPIAVYVLALVAAIAWIAGATQPNGIKQLPAYWTVAWAVAGAYFWIVHDLLGRFIRRDLVPAALYGYAFRFIICVPIAYALAFLLNFESQVAQAAIAFLLGVFPTNTLILILRRRILQRLGLGEESEKVKYELEDLQGVTTAIAEKFGDLGVATNVQLAYEDPIQLTMRTNLPFRYVIDVMSQALLAIYCPNMGLMRKYSIRSSMDASTIYDELSDPQKEIRQRARTVIDELAGELKIPSAALEKMFRDIDGDPANKFLMALPF